MKNTYKKITTAMILVLSLANAAYAGNTFTIPVSCSIPAVPGLNAPILENKAVANTAAKQDTRIAGQPAAQKEEVKYVMQQDKKDGSSITVTSVYIR